MWVDAGGDAVDVLRLAPVEHHAREGAVELFLAQLHGELVGVIEGFDEMRRRLCDLERERVVGVAGPVRDEDAEEGADLGKGKAVEGAVGDARPEDQRLAVRERGGAPPARRERVRGGVYETGVAEPLVRVGPVVLERAFLGLDVVRRARRRGRLALCVDKSGRAARERFDELAPLALELLCLFLRHFDLDPAAAAAAQLGLDDVVPVELGLELVWHGRRLSQLALGHGVLAAELVGAERLGQYGGVVAAVEVAQDERPVDDELGGRGRDAAGEHAIDFVQRRDIFKTGDRQSRRVDDVADDVQAAAAGAARHLPKFVDSEPAMALLRAGVVGLVQLREGDAARGHVDADRESLGGEDELDEALLEAELDKLAENGEHAGMVVGDPAAQESVDVSVGLELAELGHVPLHVLAVQGAALGLDRGDALRSLGLALRPLARALLVGRGRFLLNGSQEQVERLAGVRPLDAELARHAEHDARELVGVV
mmetsp:Transcript_15805/g.49504  ORF Transcript_15805/g.49504 Transcript_15805/m.49504 type:complete len:484 (+) Transcript_15805:351-1802(+)